MCEKTAATYEMVVKQETSNDIQLSAVADFSPSSLLEVLNSADSTSLHSSTEYTQPHFKPAPLTDVNFLIDNFHQVKTEICDDLTELKQMHAELIDNLSIASDQSTQDKNVKVVTESFLEKFERHQPVDKIKVNTNINNLQSYCNTQKKTIKPGEIWEMCSLKFMFKEKKVCRPKNVELDRNPHGYKVCVVKLLLGNRPEKRKKNHSSGKYQECDVCHKKFTLKVNLELHKKFSCVKKTELSDKCPKKDITQKQLTLHKKVDPKEKLECDVCQKKFSYKSHLTIHQNSHTEKKPHQCEVFPKTFSHSTSKQDKKLHNKVNTGKTYLCKDCPKMYCSEELSIMHKKVHNKYECDECHKGFCHKHKLNSHKKINPVEKPNEFDVCHKSINQSCTLEQHKKVGLQLGEMTHGCKMFHEQSIEQVHSTQEERKSIGCDEGQTKLYLCAYSEELEKNYLREKAHECNVCLKKFTSSQSLAEHTKLHSEDKTYLCNECPKMYFSKKLLMRHKKVHSKDKFECHLCHKKFPDKYRLHSHKKTHTDTKPYECVVCCKKFTLSSTLKQHTKIHAPYRVKEYDCDICNKSFFTNGHLTHHKKLHSGEKTFLCDKCSKMYFTLNQLNVHIKAHSKRYECNVCKKKFAYRDKLNIHERIHTGEKPHECDVCGRKFLRADYLKKHKHLHTRV